MDDARIPRMMRRLRGATSRRAVLGALVGAMSIVPGRAGTKTPPARHSGHGNPGGNGGHGNPHALLRGISVLLVNPAAARSTPRIEGVETEYLGRCTLLGVINLAPGKDALFDTHNTALTLQVNRRYRFFFANVVFMRPYVTVAIAGSDDLCPTRVTTVLDRTPMDEGDVVTVTVEGHVFTIRRNADKSDFKYFTLEFPSTL